MSPAAILTLIGILAAAAVGAVGWIFAGVANSRAAKSNAIAKEAVKKADEANRIAEAANKLSEEANTLASRTVAAQTEDWHVDWRADWFSGVDQVVLKNRGQETALDASVIISAKISKDSVYAVHKWPNGVAPNTDVTVWVNDVSEARARYWPGGFELKDVNGKKEVTVRNVPFLLVLTISVHWRTGEGFPRSQELEIQVW